LIGLAVLPALALASWREPDADDRWLSIWAAVEEWRAAEPRADAGPLLASAQALGDPLRLDLLRALIAGAQDDGARAALGDRLGAVPGGATWPLSGSESWLAARVLPPGVSLGRCILAALDAGDGVLSNEQLTIAYGAGVEAAEDLRLGEAIAIQRAVHARAAAEWSAFNLTLSLRRAGDYDGADRVLAEQIERAPSPEVVSQRGLNALGAGRVELARSLLGTAVARGSRDAALILARLDLAAGRIDAARNAFRALVAQEPPGAWALRGWGVALVESSVAAPSTGSPSSVP
jgi:hypothetical protein